MNRAFRNLALARAQSAIAEPKAAFDLPHKGLKGHLREILIRDLMRPFLPMDLGIGSGQIVSSYDTSSPQQDIIVYEKRIAPPVVFEAGYGVFPLESVLFTVEVKSVLTASALRTSDRAARSVTSLVYRPTPDGSSIEGVITHLVAFSSDLSRSELDRYTSMLNGRAPGLLALCVVGKGYWFHCNEGWEK